MKTVLIIGATRNLGKHLADFYATEPNTIVYATARYGKPFHHPPNIHWISGVDVSNPTAGSQIALHYNNEFPIDVLIFVATSSSSLFTQETLEKPEFDREVQMYKTTAIGPIFVIHNLLQHNLLRSGAKILFLSHVAGSIGLQHEISDGGNFGHRGSNAALSMIGHLLSLELRPKGISVGIIYPGVIGFEDDHPYRKKSSDMPSEEIMSPTQAAKVLADFIDAFGIDMTGYFWAVRGAEGIPHAEKVLNPTQQTAVPLKLPW